ncbi:tectonic-like complex member MKS1 [Tubulanus polymorphus]|uniref:tectonic-like complex member MKS1 n=1 Tax=Tubulanus polymorphus TaxID=672921 RepID=UPI003DA3B5CE
MADLFGESDVGTAYYRSRDPVKNIKIRVNLRKVTSSSTVPQANLGEKSSSGVELRSIRRQQEGESRKDDELYLFDWQEKCFSAREFELYGNEANCETVLERKYHGDITKLRDKGRPNKRLFSYVDHDNFTSKDQLETNETTLPDAKPTLLAGRMASLRQRKVLSMRPTSDSAANVPRINIVELNPSKDKKDKNHFMHRPTQTMHIMADLGSGEQPSTDDDEFVLCTINVDSNGVVSVCPDFSRGRKPYRVETSTMGRDAFEYTLEHVSKQMTRQEQDREMKMYKELYTRHSEFLESCVGNEFEMPPADVLRLVVNGEILTAKNFEYDDLYIHYFLELPRNWFGSGHDQMSGVTHTCRCKIEGRDNIAHFSFPFRFEVFYKNDTINPNNRDDLPALPVLYFEVLSLDNWSRYRTEGYGYLNIPLKAGSSTKTIYCWRPLGNSHVSQLRRFFIGGCPELEDPTYTSTPTTFDGTHMSKYGFRTESTGEVTLRFNIIQQSRSFLDSNVSKKKVGTLIDRLGGAAIQANIMGVIQAFQDARQRMLSAREGIGYLKDLKIDDENENDDEDDREDTLMSSGLESGYSKLLTS